MTVMDFSWSLSIASPVALSLTTSRPGEQLHASSMAVYRDWGSENLTRFQIPPAR
jgi:hypothetical protein